MPITLSVVIPVFNEEKNIDLLYSRLKDVLKKITGSHEIVFVDDGSQDSSLPKIIAIRKKDKWVKVVSLSRNFGHMPAIVCGLTNTMGSRVVIMDADLQDPPEVIAKMWQKAKAGYDVVYGIKRKRKESLTKKFLFKVFYRILNGISNYKMPLDSGTFSLIDRKIVNILIDLPERNKYLSGLRAWAGYKQTGVSYERPKRHAGQATSLKKLTKLALDGLLSFSYVPLRLASVLGLLTASTAFLFILIVIVLRIFLGFGLIGWASTLSAILLLGGVQLITLGIIGEYLARIYDQVKSRPEYIVSKKIGFRK